MAWLPFWITTYRLEVNLPSSEPVTPKLHTTLVFSCPDESYHAPIALPMHKRVLVEEALVRLSSRFDFLSLFFRVFLFR